MLRLSSSAKRQLQATRITLSQKVTDCTLPEGSMSNITDTAGRCAPVASASTSLTKPGGSISAPPGTAASLSPAASSSGEPTGRNSFASVTWTPSRQPPCGSLLAEKAVSAGSVSSSEKATTTLPRRSSRRDKSELILNRCASLDCKSASRGKGISVPSCIMFALRSILCIFARYKRFACGERIYRYIFILHTRGSIVKNFPRGSAQSGGTPQKIYCFFG